MFNFILILLKDINWQKPQIIKKLTKKKQAVAHCVHTLRNITDERIDNLMKWIYIQKSIGIVNIKLYALEDNVKLDKLLILNNLNSYVQIIKHDLSFKSNVFINT